ncbi:DUF2927 domain-containing protein [Tropicibacter oceani]|uniref:DUF2927 domain-containing protein n=1 Tax=Tropicibacter oceani TaxID=3058420 RepID=A0ABY8QHK9_9RHOB|nr:DUF2927 domain-containing protein [Tropicibacter oceani]WGW03481.1 DUF2927 domain-containing protein [Tropicibacter oceani]
MRWKSVTGLLLVPASLAAQEVDFVETTGPLSDRDFYRLVACAAPPGADCAKPMRRWVIDRPLRVSITRSDRAFLGGKQARARAALVRAVQYLNQSGAGVQFRIVPPEDPADIEIYFIDTDGSAPISGTGIDGIDGATVQGARVLVWANSRTGAIKRSRIVFGTRLSIRQYESALIEELTQSLGLLTDIRNPHYEGLSVFSQDSNDAKTLGPQDIIALRRHYPPKE